MKINAIGHSRNIGFCSLRTDKKEIEILKKGDKPILENKKYNILASLNNMTENPDRTGIEFLLDVAQNLQYGQNGDSEFKNIIDNSTDAACERENTNWSKILSDTISKALAFSSEDVSDLEEQYNKLFNSTQPLTPEQEQVLELRNIMKQAVLNEDTLVDANSLNMAAQISGNIDYFISSSEIPLSQKKACLEKFIYFLSDEYKINPQLKDRKLQVVDEMLNDMVVNNPETLNDLNVKSVNQLYTGMCAAISVCRKAMAYEDKLRFMEIIMDELSDSPTMEIYDITTLDPENPEGLKKISIPKIDIDYDAALSKGYRIIDASAHIWMNNAHASGDGTIQTEQYTAFDSDSYGILDDTSWFEGLAPELSKEKTLLKYLIVEKELVESVISTRKKAHNANQQILSAKNKAIELQSAVNGKLTKIFSDIFPELSETEISKLQKKLIAFYKGTGEDNSVNISEKYSAEVKQQKLLDFISEQMSCTENQKQKLKEKAKTITSLTGEYVSAERSIKKLSVYNSFRGEYDYYKKLYKLAAAHRLAIEADVNLDDGVIRFERTSGLPPRDVQILTYLKSLKGSKLPENRSQEELVSDIVKIETLIPQQIDYVLKQLIEMDMGQLNIYMLEDLKNRVQANDKNAIIRAGVEFKVGNDKDKIIKNIEAWINRIENSPSSENIQESVRILGFENRIEMTKYFINGFFASLQQGISEEDYNKMIERFCGADNVTSSLNDLADTFKNIVNQYEEINNKWNVPVSRDLILQKLERTNEILSRKKLNILQKHFDSILQGISENESIADIKERRKANLKLYHFTDEEKDIFKSIEKTISQMRKYAKMQYASMNRGMFDLLEEQYADIGMLNGQFWVREEGSTGLMSNEQARIYEQMTGKPYHISYDVEAAAREIKKGEGSGVISYSVEDSDYGFHSMYAPVVTSETFINPVSGEKETKDVIWTDNSWGKAERDYFWDGKNGFNYTDYGQGMGLKNGFVLRPDMKIGLPVKEINEGVGYSEKEKEKFGIFMSMLLPGMPVNAYQKLYKMFGYILAMNQGETNLQALESSIKDGDRINVKFLIGLDDLAEKRIENLNQRIEKEIKTKEDFDKLPDDDDLKFLMSMLSLYLSTDNMELAEDALEAKDMKDIEELKEEFWQDHVNQIGAILAKSDECISNLILAASPEIEKIFAAMKDKFGVEFDEDKIDDLINDIFVDEDAIKENDGTLNGLERYLMNQAVKVARNTFKDEEPVRYFTEEVQKCIKKTIDESLRITSLDCPALTDYPFKNELIAAVDKYLKPKSDEELLDLIQGLQNADYDLANKFIEVLQPEDIGLNFRDPYDYIIKLKTEISSVSKAFSEVVGAYIIYRELESINKKPAKTNNDTEDDEDAVITSAELFRDLYIRLSEMDVQKYIKNFKAEFFDKYKVRQAFPEPVVLTDEDIAKPIEQLFSYIKQTNDAINNNKQMIKLFKAYEDAIYTYMGTDWFKALMNKQNYIPTADSKPEIDDFRDKLYVLLSVTKADESIENINNELIKLISELSVEGEISGIRAGRALISLQKIFDEWDKSSINKDKFINLNNREISELHSNFKLLVDSNIEPKYRDKALKQLNQLTNLIRKKAPEDEIEEAEAVYMDLAVEKHISKNPTELLKECVRLLQEGKDDTEQYRILRSYLVQALKVAQQTKVQYKLVQNAHDAVSSKTKDLLSLFSVYLEDGKKESMDSEAGMLYLINQLMNEGDDNKTLILFLQQTGLSEKALSAALNNFNINESYKLIDEKYDEITTLMKELNDVSAAVSEFYDKNRIQFKSFKSAIEHLTSFVKRRTQDAENNSVLKFYLSSMESIELSDELKSLSPSMILPLLQSFNRDIYNSIAETVNGKLDFIDDVEGLLEERFRLIDIIDVPEESEVAKKKEDFCLNYNKLQEYLNQKMQELSDKLNELQYLKV